MKYFVKFKKVDDDIENDIHVDDKRLIVFESFFSGNLQYSKNMALVFREWLTEKKEKQEDICGNSCCLTDYGDNVLLEDIYWDIAIKILLKKNELIMAIDKWVEFCHEFRERIIEFSDIQFIEDSV